MISLLKGSSRKRATHERVARAGDTWPHDTPEVDLHPSRDQHASVRIAILSGVLFLSGIGALIFETLWLRLSGLAFGNSVWAAALILSSFMAGLAFGNAIAASTKVRRWRPLRLDAALELAVAFFGCT